MNEIFPFYTNFADSNRMSFDESEFLKSNIVPEYKQRVQQLDGYKASLQKDIDQLFDFKAFQDKHEWLDDWVGDEDEFDWYYEQFKHCCKTYGCEKLQQSNFFKTMPFFGQWEIIKTDKNINVYFEDNITHPIELDDGQDSVVLSIATQNDINKMVHDYKKGLGEEMAFEQHLFGKAKNFDTDRERYKNWIDHELCKDKKKFNEYIILLVCFCYFL